MILDKIIEAINGQHKMYNNITAYFCRWRCPRFKPGTWHLALQKSGRKAKVILEEEIPFVYRFPSREKSLQKYIPLIIYLYDSSYCIGYRGYGKNGEQEGSCSKQLELQLISITTVPIPSSPDYNFVQPSSCCCW